MLAFSLYIAVLAVDVWAAIIIQFDTFFAEWTTFHEIEVKEVEEETEEVNPTMKFS